MALQEGLQYVLEPLAPQRGIAAEPGRLEKDFYGVLFSRTAALPEEARWTRSQKKVMQRHRQLLDEQIKEQKIMFATRTRDGDSYTFATVGMSAPSRAAAEAFAAADPAVAAGLLGFEVLSLNESPTPKYLLAPAKRGTRASSIRRRSRAWRLAAKEIEFALRGDPSCAARS